MYSDLLAQIQAHPPTITDSGRTFEINSDGLQMLMFSHLYNPNLVAQMPYIIVKLKTGHYDVLSHFLPHADSPIAANTMTWGAFFSNECRGEIAFSSAAEYEAVLTRLPQWRNSLGSLPGGLGMNARTICQAWGLTSPSGLENTAVKSDLPTLLLSGQFDPVTPPAFMKIAAQQLKNAYAFEFPGQAHAVSLVNACGLSVVKNFLQNPGHKPNADCLKSLAPDFN